MRIYFSAAIYQEKQFGEVYKIIVNRLKKLGHEVMQDTTETSLEDAINKNDEQRIEYYKKVLSWITKADIVVLEASFPSTLHIGHEITLALDKNKPVVALYKKGFEPSFFLGLEHEKLLWVEYTEKDLEQVLIDAIGYASEQINTRFTFFISPTIESYLDWVVKHYDIPRSVFIRKLIEDNMSLNKSYKTKKDEI